MIDPFHMYLARRPSARAAESRMSNVTNKQPDTGHTSNSSSVDSKSLHSSYFGGVGLSPASTASTDQATKTSWAGSSSSSNNATTLQHKLPELEHFRQSSPLMPEFYPRTSEFFSQGRRRSSITANPDAAAGSITGAAPAIKDALITQHSNPPKKPDSFHLPLTFEESDSLVGEQLPVRLGLAPPSHSHGLSASEVSYKARVGHGYYFYTPPPAPRPSASSKGSVQASLRRTTTDFSNYSSSPQAKGPQAYAAVDSTSPESVSPGLASSPHCARADSAMSCFPGSTPVGHSSSPESEVRSMRPRLPPPSPDCWHPDAYFTTTRSRVRGKMREYVHHAFPSSVVPYWHGYNRETIEAEMSIHLNVNAALHGNTLRDFPEGSRPCRVLDLGCGRGVWCLDMAREWNTSEFVGLDIVPIQPPLDQLADPDVHHRVSWVVANFLEPLPFPDASFDYVHVRFVLQGVPEDSWVEMFSEARRILAPGGVLEVVEGNYSFFGHASLVDVQELKDLEHGRTVSRRGSGVKLPKRLKLLNDASDSADIDAIEIVLERMMHRRFINPTPLSVVPSALLLPGFSTVANGNPRHIPVYAESSAQRARARAADEAGSSSANATSSEDEGKRQGKFTSRGQIGKPLNSQFAMTDQDLFCALIILQQIDLFSSSRELVWAEAEEEKRSLQGIAQPELARMDNSRRFGQGNPAALKPFAHPWKSKDQFFRAFDAWTEATRASADTKHMLRKYLGWEQEHEDLTVEGRKCAERRRKMSTSSVAIPLLGLDQLVLEDPVNENTAAAEEEEEEKREALAALQEMDRALGTSDGAAFAMLTTHAHEAPARLQTTRSSAHDTRAYRLELRGANTSKATDKKKKLPKRPSSSGGVASTTTSIAGVQGRSRAFGRGGLGGHIPLPDAPAFMVGYAFASLAPDPHSMFRSPATKASIGASSRSSRKGSSSKSFSDRSSILGKTEKDDTNNRAAEGVDGTQKKTLPTVTQQQTLQSQAQGAGMTPAAAYAATQRLSNGLEEEPRMRTQMASEARRLSRPVSPISAVQEQDPSTRTTALGSRPPMGGAQGSADSRSVSMPATMASTGQPGTVRIAEPPIKPSKENRSRSKSNTKAVAMIGFYDCTGFLATA